MRVGEHLGRNARAYVILLISLAPALFAFYRVNEEVKTRDESRFDRAVQRAVWSVEQGANRHVDELIAIRGLFAAGESVDSDEWRRYLETVDLPGRLKGLEAVGFIERAVSEGAPEIRPAFRVLYATEFPEATPGWRPGTTVSGERLAAVLEEAAASGKAVVGAAAELSGVERPGLWIYLPVYRSGLLPEAPDDRRAFLAGYVFASLDSGEFLDAALPADLGLAVRWVIRSRDGREHFLEAGAHESDVREARFERRVEIPVLNTTWRLGFASKEEFEADSAWYLPWLTLGGGLLISALLFRVSWGEARARYTAETLNRNLEGSREKLRQTNEELACERHLLQSLLRHSPDRIYFKDLESRFITGSAEVARRLNLKTPEELIGKSDFDFFSEEHARAAFEDEQRIIRTGEPLIGKVEREVWHDGEVSWVLTTKLPLRDKDGRIAGTFGTSKEITALKRSEEAIAAEKERLAVTLRAIGDGVIGADIEGRVVVFNTVAEEITGWTFDEAVGRRLDELCRFRDEQAGRAMPDPVETVISGRSDGFDGAVILLDRKGDERLVACRVSPILDSGEHATGAVLVLRDIAAQRRIEEELFKAGKLESIGVLAGGIAHDFNNVLTAITGNLSLARASMHSTELLIERIADAEAAAIRARDLTRHLLTFAKGGDPIRKPVRLVEGLRNFAQLALAGGSVKCDFNIVADLWPAEVDEGQVGQVINNLALNAREAMSDGGRIEISAANVTIENGLPAPLPAGRYVRIAVRDHGPGIAAEHLPKIFDPYFSTKRHGAGLGLATAYSIVRKHEGQIRVESSPETGTVFEVYLPASVGGAGPERERQTEFAGQGRILVMDDEENIRKVAAMMLGVLGYRVETACDGAEAIALYCRAKAGGTPFDAVIMDLTVPDGMGGKETIQRLKELDPGVRAIVSSGYSYDPVMANYREHGFCGVVPKPYSVEDIGRTLREILGAAQNTPPA